MSWGREAEGVGWPVKAGHSVSLSGMEGRSPSKTDQEKHVGPVSVEVVARWQFMQAAV